MDKSEQAREFRLMRPMLIFLALLLRWFGSKMNEPRSIEGEIGSRAAALYEAVGRLRVKGGGDSWFAKWFDPDCAKPAGRPNPLHRLFARNRTESDRTFRFRLTDAWRDAEIRLFVGGANVSENRLAFESKRWEEVLLNQAESCVRKVTSRHAPNPRAEILQRAMTCAKGDLRGLQEAISSYPRPTDPELSDYSKDTVQGAGLRILGHLTVRDSWEPYDARLAKARFAARLFSFVKDPLHEFESHLHALAALRPLNRPAVALVVVREAEAVMTNNRTVARQLGPRLMSELAAMNLESMEVEWFSILSKVEFDCRCRLRRGSRTPFATSEYHRFADRRRHQLTALADPQRGRELLLTAAGDYLMEKDTYGYANTLLCVSETFAQECKYAAGLEFFLTNANHLKKGSLWVRAVLDGVEAYYLIRLGRELDRAVSLAQRSVTNMREFGIAPSLRRGESAIMISPDKLLAERAEPNSTCCLLPVRASTPVPSDLIGRCCDLVTGR
jgi:hypothetical protein